MTNSYTKILSQLLGVEVIAEHKFHPVRRWRFDYAILDKKIAIEVEGGVWSNGRHTRGSGFLKDIEKYNNATLLGWRLVRCTPQTLLSSKFIDFLKKLIKS